MGKITQKERIIKYIKDFGSITDYEATTELGILQFGARLKELKEQGYQFKQELQKTKNRYGDTVHFYKYSFMEDLDKMIEENINHISI